MCSSVKATCFKRTAPVVQRRKTSAETALARSTRPQVRRAKLASFVGELRAATSAARPGAPSLNAAKAAGFEETSMPDHFGAFGGRYIPETLAAAHAELEKEYEAAMADPAFREELAFYRKQFIGGPTPLYADRV